MIAKNFITQNKYFNLYREDFNYKILHTYTYKYLFIIYFNYIENKYLRQSTTLLENTSVDFCF